MLIYSFSHSLTKSPIWPSFTELVCAWLPTAGWVGSHHGDQRSKSAGGDQLVNQPLSWCEGVKEWRGDVFGLGVFAYLPCLLPFF